MIKKTVVEISDPFFESQGVDIDKYITENVKLQEVVTFFKNMITHYYENKSWDKYKKLTNEYELIFSSPNTSQNISKYTPVSRSFFKLWEILHDFKNDIFTTEKEMRTLFLAEGPGGFAEALVKFRHDYFKGVAEDDEYFGMTLKSNNKNIPDWKYKHPQLQVTYSRDGTGSLYVASNIDALEEMLGAGSIDFVTADGGFDFSADFNNQEEMALQLFICEIYASMRLQRVDGTLIIKVFDIFTPATIKIINLLNTCYKRLIMFKPLTSRPANSEKYLICMGFHGCQHCLHIFDALSKLSIDNNTFYHDVNNLLKDVDVNTNVTRNLVLFNSFYISRQILYIQKTIEYIKKFIAHGDIKRIIDGHVIKVQKWCEKYNIPHKE
jgi:23S rRNA U2552 (ribose-2'-O)-methylase RlmE/FtsJ